MGKLKHTKGSRRPWHARGVWLGLKHRGWLYGLNYECKVLLPFRVLLGWLCLHHKGNLLPFWSTETRCGLWRISREGNRGSPCLQSTGTVLQQSFKVRKYLLKQQPKCNAAVPGKWNPYRERFLFSWLKPALILIQASRCLLPGTEGVTGDVSARSF